MAGEKLANFYRQYFLQAQPQVLKEEKIIEDVVFKSPFLTAESIFEDILPSINSDKFYALSLIGPQGKGKTLLASIFGTIAEDNGFLVIYAKAEDIFLDLPLWVDKVKELILQHGSPKVCFVMDDMSYSSDTISKKQAAIFKHFVADIRHVFEKVLPSIKIKVFMIYISHRLHSLPPMLRNSGSWIFSSMQSADREDAVKLIARRKEMREKLDTIYTFISQISIDGPKYVTLKFSFGSNNMEFVWGTEENPGDGRLTVSFPAGDLKIFNSKLINNMIDVESDLYRIKYIPPQPPTEKELEDKKQNAREEFESKAKKITEALNTNIQNEKLPEITALVPVRQE